MCAKTGEQVLQGCAGREFNIVAPYHLVGTERVLKSAGVCLDKSHVTHWTETFSLGNS
jgi:hypothetical protein